MSMLSLVVSLCGLKFLSSVLYVSKYRSFTSFVRFIPMYFVTFVAIRIVLLISISDSLMLVYRMQQISEY